MSDTRKDLPPVSAANFLARVREVLQVYLGSQGSELDRGLTVRDIVGSGLATLNPNGGSDTLLVPSVPTGGTGGGSSEVYEPDLTIPPSPSSFTAVAGLTSILVETEPPIYSAGHGHGVARLFGVTRLAGDPLPTFASAVELSQFQGDVTSYATGLGKIWHLWLIWRSKDGVDSAPAGGTNGVSVTTGRIGTSDLNDLIIEAGKLANGAVTADKFTAGIEPVTIVASVPGAKVTSTVFNTADGKLYRWSGSVYVKTIPTEDLSGAVTDAQIAGMAASKVTGALTDAQIAAVAAAKITGTLSASQIADGSISETKFASGVEPVSIVSSVPGAKTTNAIFNTADGKLYRWSGSAYVASVPTSDLSGSITSTQITDGAISTVKLAANAVTATEIAAGTITSAQIAADTITAGNIAAGAVTASELAAGAVTAGKIAANAVTATEIAAGSVTTAKLAADAVTANEIAAGAVTASEIAAGAVTTAKLVAGAVTANEIAAGAVVAGKVAANAITATELAADSVTAGKVAAGSITASKLFVTGAGAAMNADPSCMDSSAWLSSPVMLTGQADMPAGSTAIANTTGAGEDVLTAELIPIEQLKRYRVEALVKQTVGSTGIIYLGVAWYDANKALLTSNADQPGGAGSPAGWSNGSYSYFGLIGVAAPATWTRYVASFGSGEAKAIPSNAKYIKLVALLNYGSTAGVQHAVSGFKLMEKADADLIVDGAIVASKLAANAIAVGTAAVQNGAIVNAMIGTAAIDDAKISNLSAAKLTAGDGTIGGDLKSSNFATGSAGWRVRPDGTAEFGFAHIRGTLQASQVAANFITANMIDARGLSIKDASGNVILSAGSAIDWSKIGGASLNLAGLGYTGALDATKGAPTGTSVGGSPAETVAVKALAALQKTGDTITGRINMSVADGLFAGTDTNNGIYLGNSGLVGKKAGVTTFAVDTAGNAVFAGEIAAGSIDVEKLSGTSTSYATPGTYSFTLPAGFTVMRVTLWAGGGGGGGARSIVGYHDFFPYQACGGGGGQGGRFIATFTGLTPGATYTVVVGAGGVAGQVVLDNSGVYTAPASGGSGGNSSISGPGISATAYGGSGGASGYPIDVGGTYVCGSGGGGGGGGGAGSNGAAGSGYAGSGDGGGVGGGNQTINFFETAQFGSPIATLGIGGNGLHGLGAYYGSPLGHFDPESGRGGFCQIEAFNPNGIVKRSEWDTLITHLNARFSSYTWP